MHAQLSFFDGPRSPELTAAGEFAGRQRIEPAVLADPVLADELIGGWVLRQPDGGEVIVTITRTADGLERMRDCILGTELLPDEDPALLPGPDRVEIFEVVTAFGPVGRTAAAGAATAGASS